MPPHIKHHIGDSPHDAVNQFCVLVRWELEMHSAHDTAERRREKLLYRGEVEAKLGKCAGMKGFHEFAACIPRGARCEQLDARKDLIEHLNHETGAPWF